MKKLIYLILLSLILVSCELLSPDLNIKDDITGNWNITSKGSSQVVYIKYMNSKELSYGGMIFNGTYTNVGFNGSKRETITYNISLKMENSDRISGEAWSFYKGSTSSVYFKGVKQ